MKTDSTITEEQYQRLKAEVERASTKASQAQGALNQLISQLKSQYQCSSLKEARALLEKLQKQAAHAKQEFDDAYTTYREEFPES